MVINNLLIKHYLKNVLFITGTACAGKTTIIKMLAEKYGLILRGENYDCIPSGIIDKEKYPNIFYWQSIKDWQEYINKDPHEYTKWMMDRWKEYEEFEISYLMHISNTKKVIVDTGLSLETLKEIADYNQVAVMLSPLSLSIKYYFDRNDPDKIFIKEQILKAENPEKTMENYLACVAESNKYIYDKWINRGFFTIIREDNNKDTKLETLSSIAKHFKLEN